MSQRLRREAIKNAFLICAILLLGSMTVHLLYAGIRTKFYIATGNQMAHQTKPYSQQAAGDTSILILGDSLAYGVGTSSSESSFAGLVGKRFPEATIINKAHVGEDSGSLAESLDSLVDKHYAMIFLIVGGNDVSHYSVNLDQSTQNLARIYDKLSQHADHVYAYTSIDFARVAAIPPILKPYYSNRSRVLRDQSIQLAQSYPNIMYIDTFGVDPGDYASMQATDGFHLNDHGVSTLMNLTFQD